ncbi:hypothetical protein SAMN04488128_103167 [Chitinophaga eiseniae]|uniref:Uncharacterized protein n=1 Tax=Chitinophaga eiseniae TaxID=634771 RepID=A0A1T4SNL9_9BACT|nr:hypothetical protein [Chitinophaga eiseniae]SKA29746.1 hypothetical protein SAMN04488128_103167 [Chitinophaga eiseniae]
MPYFHTHTLSFIDNHEIHPVAWRADIWDDEANGGATPIILTPSAEPLVLERVDTSDDKATIIIGQQATLQYEFTGAPDEPLPAHFFDVDERRFRIDVYRADVLYGRYYVKPDSCTYEYKAPPYTVTLTAVDGLSFTKGVKWDAYKGTGLIDYRWMDLYDVLITRGLMQVMEDDMEVNVINTLRPENIGIGGSFLNDLYVHSDMFFDFAKGPDDVYTVLEKVCKQFYLRLFIAQNKIWIIRMPDLLRPAITAENYILGIKNIITLQTARRTIGVSRAAKDATPVDDFANIIMFPAIKKVELSLDYRSLNRLANFDWSVYHDFPGVGTQFQDWPGMIAPDVQQHGSGTKEDPYTAFLQYNSASPGEDFIINFFGGVFVPPEVGSPRPGDIIQLSFKYKFRNVDAFKIRVVLAGPNPGQRLYLSSSGDWTYGPVADIDIRRSGRKQIGSLEIKSVPIPTKIGEFETSSQLELQTSIYTPTDPNTLDAPDSAQGVEIYPIKIGIIPMSSVGRKIIDTNNGRFSKPLEDEKFYFMDTGLNGLANTISVSDTGVPSEKWASETVPADKLDVEQHLADSIIDQYARPVYGWEGNLYSNTIEFWHIFSFDYLFGRQFVQTTDRYIVKTCTHVTNLQEVLPENGADTTYTEFDIEDSNDE